jgi:two-component system sensor histidine kinase PilS (NtrC family)
MSDANLYIIQALTIGIILLLALYIVVLIYLRMRRARKKTEGTSEVGFVVDTFHELVSALKAKEKELEILRKKAEEKAGIIEGYNENILQSVPSGVISLDKEWKIVKVNSSAERILQVKAEDIIGKGFREVFGSLDAEGTVQRGEAQYVTGSGKRIWLGFTLSPLLDADKNTIGQLFVFTDLTELKALEAQAELRQRLSSLGEMAAGIAHELRNPMGVIAGYMRLLEKKVDPSVQHIVDAVSKEVAAMDRIITEFLSFAKPKELDLSDVNLFSLIESTVENTVDEKHGIEVLVDVDKAFTLQADEVLLRQAFANLLQNAVEAMSAGGKIYINADVGDQSVTVSITDTGYGIPENIKDRIFLPFYTTKEKGTGLGLAIVHRIITSHGGNIDVESSDKGTTFRIRLPLKKAE